MNIRRLPGFMYHYKVITLLLFTTMLFVIYLLLHWGIMCTNLEAWRHVSNVVSEKENTRITVSHTVHAARTGAYTQVALGSHFRRHALEGVKIEKESREKGTGNEETHAPSRHVRNWLILCQDAISRVYLNTKLG